MAEEDALQNWTTAGCTVSFESDDELDAFFAKAKAAKIGGHAALVARKPTKKRKKAS
jgi:hypothetical protein